MGSVGYPGLIVMVVLVIVAAVIVYSLTAPQKRKRR
ncbi:hypothetical protein PMI05_00749 [Brevibacillus sp. BC25]|nr:hypothetical protein PMI05_00749 [Brevibacillus sp. BC25]